MGDNKKSNFELLAEEILRTAVCNPAALLPPLILPPVGAKDKNTKPPTEEEILNSVAFGNFSAEHSAIVTQENHPELFESYNQLAQAMGIPNPPPLLYVDSERENALHLTYYYGGKEKQTIFYSSAFDNSKYTKEEREAVIAHELGHHHLCNVRQDNQAKEICEASWFDNIRAREVYADYMSLKINGREGIEGLLRSSIQKQSRYWELMVRFPNLLTKRLIFVIRIFLLNPGFRTLG